MLLRFEKIALSLSLAVGCLAYGNTPKPHGNLTFNGILTAGATVDTDHKHQERLPCMGCDVGSLNFGQASLGLAGYYWASDTETLQLAIGAQLNSYNWNDNLYYSQTQFYEGWLQLGAETKAIENWTWRSLAQVYADVYDMSSWRGQGIIWGRYSLNERMGLHIGGYATAGLEYGRILPIVGFDSALPWDMTLRLIFPLEFSLMRQHSSSMRYGLAARIFTARNRFTKQDMPSFCMQYIGEGASGCAVEEWMLTDASCECAEDADCNNCWPSPCGIVPGQPCIQRYTLNRGYIQYSNYGLEALFNWWPFLFADLSIVAGVTTVGELRLSDCNDARFFHRYFKPTAYGQIALTVYF